jgi:hypothetical protein
VEAALILAAGQGPASGGVYSPSEAFPAGQFLRSLEKLGAFTVRDFLRTPDGKIASSERTVQ